MSYFYADNCSKYLLPIEPRHTEKFSGGSTGRPFGFNDGCGGSTQTEQSDSSGGYCEGAWFGFYGESVGW